MITDEDCKTIIKNYLPNSDVKFISFKTKSFFENVEGFMGEHFSLIINYETEGIQKSQKFFVKSQPTQNDAQKNMTESLGMFEREIFAYENLLKEFEKYGYDTSFAGKSYYSISNAALVMEDMTLKGYSSFGKESNFTLEHFKCMLKSAASYHAAGYALERTKSKELNKDYILGDVYKTYLSEILFPQYIDQTIFTMNWWRSTLKALDLIIDFLPQDDSYKQHFKQLLKTADIGKPFALDAKSKIKKTCVHSDMWSNNILFKNENNIPIKSCLVDFQITKYTYPCMDVLMAIYSNTGTQFRKQYTEEIYLSYYKYLSEILKNYGYNIEEIHPMEDFYESIKMVKLEAIMQALLVKIVVMLPKENLNDLTDNEEVVQELFFDISKLAVNAFQNNESYRAAITDVIYDLRDALIERSNK